MDIIADVFQTHPIVTMLGAVVGAVVIWRQWQFLVRPMFVPKARIDAMADDLIEKHGPRAEERAFTEEDRAWRYSCAYEQGVWRRVRRELWRRHQVGG